MAAIVSSTTSAGERLVLDFNPDWKFVKADPAGAQQPGLDDSGWADVSTPHTYNDVDTFDDWSREGHKGESNQWAGRTWYRKTFTPPDSWRDRKVYIEFEAVRQVAEVYLNGRLLGVSKTGFTPFGFDLTAHLRFGAPNVLAVMCDNRFVDDDAHRAGEGGGLGALTARINEEIPDEVSEIQANQIPWNNPHWHPAHGGIYRNVKIHVVDPLHISLPLYSFLETAGPYVYATDVSEESVTIGIEVPVQNGRAASQRVEVTADVRDREDRSVMSISIASNLAAGASETYKLTGKFANPKLWEPTYPYLYRVVLTLKASGETVDTCEVPLGIRWAKWTIDQGFFINGHHLKLRGWGQKPTDEWPGIGNAQPDWMHYFTLNLMKQAGANFVRWGHTAGGPAHIEAADRLGIITDQPGVDGEGDTRGAAWRLRADAFRDTIIYYRNHPSILVWEGGNQKVSREHAEELHGYFEKYDPHGGRVYTHRRPDKVVAAFMDVQIGTEGGSDIGASTMPIFEGEYNREEAPRRVRDAATPRHVGGDPCTPVVFGYVEGQGSYVLTSEEFAVNQVSQFVGKLHAPNHSGGANWIFTDSTSGGRVPSEVCRASGEVDGVRLPKEAYYVCQAMFRNDPQVHIIGHWNYPAGTVKTVYVASNCDQVELLVNDKSLGRVGPGEFKGGSLRYLFISPDVTWSAGAVKAVAYKDGKPVVEQVKITTGDPVALKLTPITGPAGLLANGSDYALIDVEAVDSQGRRCPTFERRVDFTTAGPGVWRGGYNSGITNSINNTYVNLECGINRVAVRSTRQAGTITVTARCPGLREGSLTVRSVRIGANMPLRAHYEPELPATRVIESSQRWLGTATQDRAISARYITGFSYSGPTQSVQVECDAQDGKVVYVDRDYCFADLPTELIGADWVQAANIDKVYNAVDLMEIAVKGNSVVSIAHDDRLPRPAWLLGQFRQTDATLTINRQSMTIFRHRAERDESLTLGTNTENASLTACNMYVVFVNAVEASEWVYRGADGKLAYKTTQAGDRIMDFSHAGYLGGGVALPEVPVKVTVQPVEGDNTANIQEAIDKVSALEPEGPFRGAVLLAPGDYTCSDTISIRTDGVVVRGSGSGAGGSTIKMTGGRHTALSVGRLRGRRRESDSGEETRQAQTQIADAYVPSGATLFHVANASGFAAGDTIEIRRPVTEAWVEFMQMDDLVRDGRPQTWIRAGTTITTQRRITAISGNRITLEVPLSDSFDAKYLNPPGTAVVKVTPAPLLAQVGVEHLHIQAPPQHMSYTQAPYTAMRLNGEDCWARDILIEETMNSVSVGGRRITLERVDIRRTVPNVGASKPAEFAPNASQVLLNRCSGNGDNIWHVATGGRQAGPIVLLNCTFHGNGHIEGHQRWTTGMLLDNCQVPEGGIDFKNRGSMGSGHGWGVGWAVAWNCIAKTYVVQQPPGAVNWMIGCIGENVPTARPFDREPTLPLGTSDSLGRRVAPQSLYLAQLAERLGPQALKNIGY